MTEEEKLIWTLIYAAATVACEVDPAMKADNALLQLNARCNGADPYPPEVWPEDEEW